MDGSLKKTDARIGFWGTPDFAVPALQRLIREGYNISHVVTQPDKPVGRKHVFLSPPVKKLALQFAIPVLQPITLKKDDVAQWLSGEHLDLVIVAAYGKIIPEKLLTIPRLGMINIHGSLLPLLRGSSPIQSAIMQGLKETGISIQKVAAKMDEGDIFVQEVVPIAPRETAETLHDKLSQTCETLLSKTLPFILSGAIQAKPQDHGQATYTKKLTRDDGRITWTESAKTLDCFIRGLTPWPGAWTILGGKRLHIHEAVPEDLTTQQPAGTFIAQKHKLAVACGAGILRLLSVTLEGERLMSAEDFINGHATLLAGLGGHKKP